jgi:hypothetical protein
MPAFVEDVSGALKKYFRDLPEPLLSDGTPEDKLQHQIKQAVGSYHFTNFWSPQEDSDEAKSQDLGAFGKLTMCCAM